MAKTIAHAYGRGPNYESHASRLGAESSRGEAATRSTFAVAEVAKDGSGFVRVTRVIPGSEKRKVIVEVQFGPETEHDWNVVNVKNVGTMVPSGVPEKI